MLRFFFIFLFLVFPTLSQAALYWSPFLPVPSQSTTSFKLAVNTKSKALLAWHEPSTQMIKSSFYDFIEKVWLQPQIVATNGNTILLLAMNFTEANSGALLWFDTDHNSLNLSKLKPEEEWSESITLPLNYPASDMHSVFDSQGNLSVVWIAWNGVHHVIQGAFYSEYLQKWSPISDLSSIGFNCHSPKIAMNENGMGAVVWQALISKGDQVSQCFIQSVMFYQPEFKWSSPLNFGYDWINTCLSKPDVAIDKNNNIAIIWEKRGPVNDLTRIQYVRFLAKKNQWSYISEMEGRALNPQFSHHSQKVQILWIASEGSQQGLSGLNIAQFDIENNLLFSVHNLVQTEEGISHLTIKTDSLEKQNLMWLHDSILQAIHYDKEWSFPLHLDKNMSCDDFDFASDPIGNVILTILHNGQLLFCIGNYLLPPDFFDGRKIEVRYPSHKIYHGHLTWSLSKSPNVMSYVLRRNSVILAVLPVHVQNFTDYRCPNTAVSYELTIVNIDNIESLPAKRTL